MQRLLNSPGFKTFSTAGGASVGTAFGMYAVQNAGTPRYSQWAAARPESLMNHPHAHYLAAAVKVTWCSAMGGWVGLPLLAAVVPVGFLATKINISK